MSDWSERTLCSDGNCIGTINEKGYCCICGKPLDRKQNAEQDVFEGMREVKVRRQEIPKALTKALDSTAGRVIDADNDFGLRLLLQLAKQSHDKNVFISPFSVAIALAMIYNGAENATKQAMATTLGLNGLSLQEINAANRALISIQKQCDSEIQLTIANSIWIREGIALFPEFVQRISDDYDGKIVNMDFSASDAVDTINRWVADKTKGRIKTLVTRDMLNPPAILFLINAIYFKGIWEQPFKQAETKARPFTMLDGTRKQCPMMEQLGMYKYYEHSDFQAISLPYGYGHLSMYIFLPKRSSSIRELQTNLNMKNWGNWISELRIRIGQIVLPRFKLEYGTGLKGALVALGMGTAFREDANFQGMGAGPFWISEVIHKSFLVVNEKGTEAAAATGMGVLMGRPSVEEKGFTMIVDHPFVAAICDTYSGAVLFVGFILDPT